MMPRTYSHRRTACGLVGLVPFSTCTLHSSSRMSSGVTCFSADSASMASLPSSIASSSVAIRAAHIRFLSTNFCSSLLSFFAASRRFFCTSRYASRSHLVYTSAAPSTATAATNTTAA